MIALHADNYDGVKKKDWAVWGDARDGWHVVVNQGQRLQRKSKNKAARVQQERPRVHDEGVSSTYGHVHAEACSSTLGA